MADDVALLTSASMASGDAPASNIPLAVRFIFGQRALALFV